MTPRQTDSERFETLGFLARGLGHDLNNLVTIILGQVELGLLASRPSRDVLHEIRGAARQIDAQIRDFLLLLRTDARPPENVSLAPLLDDVRADIEALVPDGIELVLEAEDDGPLVRIRPGYLRRALLDLSLNAVQAMPEGGRLEIRAASRGRRPDDAWAVLSVRDTGAGMPDATAAYLTAADVSFREGGGVGLGLAMARSFVRRSGGRIAVRRPEEGGTTVELHLPASMSPAAPAAGGASGVVLVVDDEEAVLRVARSMLERRGFAVITSRSSEEARTVLETESRIDLLIAERSRADVVHAFRRDRGPLPVICVCAEPPSRGEGLDDVPLLRKPFTLADLNDALARTSS